MLILSLVKLTGLIPYFLQSRSTSNDWMFYLFNQKCFLPPLESLRVAPAGYLPSLCLTDTLRKYYGWSETFMRLGLIHRLITFYRVALCFSFSSYPTFDPPLSCGLSLDMVFMTIVRFAFIRFVPETRSGGDPLVNPDRLYPAFLITHSSLSIDLIVCLYFFVSSLLSLTTFQPFILRLASTQSVYLQVTKRDGNNAFWVVSDKFFKATPDYPLRFITPIFLWVLGKPWSDVTPQRKALTVELRDCVNTAGKR